MSDELAALLGFCLIMIATGVWFVVVILWEIYQQQKERIENERYDFQRRD